MSEAYSVLAEYYDKLMSDFNYNEFASFLYRQNLGKDGLELGCGSGEMTLRLAKNSYNMTACDMSNAMLDTASKKAIKEALNVRFINADITELELDKKFDFVVAVCDVFNYLDAVGFKKVIANAYSLLKEGGKMVFDVSSKYKLTEILGDNLYFEEYEDVSYFWQNELNKKKKCVDMDLVFFIKNKSGSYDRKEENQRQYYRDEQDIMTELAKFKSVEVFDGDFMKPTKESERLVFLAVK